MTGVWQHWHVVLIASAIGLPLVGLVCAGLVRAGCSHVVPVVLLVAGTLPWLWMILTPEPLGTPRLSLVPLRDLATLAPRDLIVQIGGNLLVFAALGALLPVRWPVGTGVVLLVAALASVTVEILQYALALGRVSSIDDVLLNALGAGLAGQLSRPWWRRGVLARRSRSGEAGVAPAPVR
jgi:hypothetical protein